jgi:hypothetical protein
MRANNDLLVSLFCSLVLHGVVLVGLPVGVRSEAYGYSRLPVYARLLMRSGPVQEGGDEAVMALPFHEKREERPSSAKILDGIERRSVVARSIDDYLPVSLLDVPPRLLDNVDTQVDLHGVEGVIGEAEILLLISSSGQVDDAQILSSSLPVFMIEIVAQRFAKVRFSPGELHGLQVRSRLRIRFSPPTADQMLGNPTSAKERAWGR